MKNDTTTDTTLDILLALIVLALIGATAAVPGLFIGAGLYWLEWIPKNGVPVVAMTWAILGIIVAVVRCCSSMARR